MDVITIYYNSSDRISISTNGDSSIEMRISSTAPLQYPENQNYVGQYPEPEMHGADEMSPNQVAQGGDSLGDGAAGSQQGL